MTQNEIFQLKEKLEMFVKYERIDAPTERKQRFGWAMYTVDKLVNFLGVDELTEAYKAAPKTTSDTLNPNIYMIVRRMLME
jgi:hypothetical protein